MTKAIKFTATAPNGQIVTRSSKTKTYAFAVIVRNSYEIAINSATNDKYEFAERNFAHYAAYLDGTSRFLKSSFRSEEEQARHNADAIEQARTNLKGATTAAEYREIIRAETIARVETKKAEGYYDDYGAYGWSSRRDLAEKAANEARGRGVYAEIIVTPIN